MALFRSLLASLAAPAVQEGEQEAAIAALEALGGSVRVIAANTSDLEAAFHLSGTELTDEGLVHLTYLPDLRWLNLRGTKVTDAGMATLAQCAGLTRLHLEKTGVGDAGLEQLKSLPELEYLNLYGTPVTDGGLAHLAEIKTLKKLYLWQSQVRPRGSLVCERPCPNARSSRARGLTPCLHHPKRFRWRKVKGMAKWKDRPKEATSPTSPPEKRAIMR